MKILCFGSLNIDTTLSVDHIVRPGETTAAKSMERFPGGKGMNQSIAMGRALRGKGIEVYHAGCIGVDGQFLKEMLEEAGVDTRYLKTVEGPTGNALIQVEESGENCIVIYAGANGKVTEAMADEVFESFEEGDMLVLQNEISSLDYILNKGREKGMTILLNPSPLDEKIRGVNLRKIDYLMVNQQEAEEMLGIDSPGDVGMILNMIAPKLQLIMTQGAKGSLYLNAQGSLKQEAFRAGTVVDTTGAGDTFTGYFAAGMAEAFVSEEMMTLPEAVSRAMRLGAAASGLAVTQMGASASIPERSVVDQYLAAADILEPGETDPSPEMKGYDSMKSGAEKIREAIERIKAERR